MSLKDNLDNLGDEAKDVKDSVVGELNKFSFFQGKAKLVSILAGVAALGAVAYFLFT